MFFKKSNPLCPVCHAYMAEAEVREVPQEARREFARTNKWGSLSLTGWYSCEECKLHIHQPTVSVLQKQRR